MVLFHLIINIIHSLFSINLVELNNLMHNILKKDFSGLKIVSDHSMNFLVNCFCKP